jgi:hypothetical protein
MYSTIYSLGEIGVSASKQKLRFTTENVIDLLREIGNESCEKGQEFLGYLDISEGYQNEGPERLQAVISALYLYQICGCGGCCQPVYALCSQYFHLRSSDMHWKR